MINYTEKGIGFHIAVAEAGYHIEQHGDGNFYSDNDVEVQAIHDSYNPLPNAKRLKRKELNTEQRSRMILVYPDAEDIQEDIFDVIIDMCFDVFRSVINASRSPNAGWQAVLDIRTAKRNARLEINAFTSVAEIEAYNVVTQPAWPV